MYSDGGAGSVCILFKEQGVFANLVHREMGECVHSDRDGCVADGGDTSG